MAGRPRSRARKQAIANKNRRQARMKRLLILGSLGLALIAGRASAAPGAVPYWDPNSPNPPCGVPFGWEDGSAISGCASLIYSYDPDTQTWERMESPAPHVYLDVAFSNLGLYD